MRLRREEFEESSRWRLALETPGLPGILKLGSIWPDCETSTHFMRGGPHIISTFPEEATGMCFYNKLIIEANLGCISSSCNK